MVMVTSGRMQLIDPPFRFRPPHLPAKAVPAVLVVEPLALHALHLPLFHCLPERVRLDFPCMLHLVRSDTRAVFVRILICCMIYVHVIGLDGIKSHGHNPPVLEKERRGE
jgi:hypothetical protein